MRLNDSCTNQGWIEAKTAGGVAKAAGGGAGQAVALSEGRLGLCRDTQIVIYCLDLQFEVSTNTLFFRPASVHGCKLQMYECKHSMWYAV